MLFRSEEAGLIDVQWVGSVEVAEVVELEGESVLHVHTLLEEERLSDAYVRRVLAERLEAFGRPAILVTHDVRDVIALGATVVALDGGRVIQRGSLDELWRSPASDFIAEFLGVA